MRPLIIIVKNKTPAIRCWYTEPTVLLLFLLYNFQTDDTHHNIRAFIQLVKVKHAATTLTQARYVLLSRVAGVVQAYTQSR